MAKINVKGTEVTIFSKLDYRDYISITDIARYKKTIETSNKK